MRNRKPAATSGPSCKRCTAVLFAGLDRCGMCGWPSGVGYPPADGELERANAVAPPADAAADGDDDDHVGVQLEALAGMVARQGQPMAPEPAAPEPSAPRPTAEAPASTEAPAPEKSSIAAGAEPAADIDPLTAPLTALEAAPEPTSEPMPSGLDNGSDEVVPAPASTEVPVAHVVAEDSATPDAPVEQANAQPSRAAAIIRPAQVLLVGTAVANLVVIALGTVLGSSSRSSTTLVLGLALVTLALWTGAAVVFLNWISRAHTHVTATSASHQRHGASMSLLGWFIPVAGFVIGYRVLQDLWTGSDPATRDHEDAKPAKVRMIDIWLLGIVTAALFGYGMPVALGDSAVWAGVSGAGLLVAALALASTMGTISAWQSETLTNDDSKVTSASDSSEPETSANADASTRMAAPEPVSAAAE